MSIKDKLLTIGEISKLTGAGIKALRYYERINLLKPAYVEPHSGYRYYSFNQTYLIGIIMFAVELDIPLKEMNKFIDEQGIIDLTGFGTYGRETAFRKKALLEKGIKLMELYGRKIESQAGLLLDQIYTKNYPEKIFYVIPFEHGFESLSQYEAAKLLLDTPFIESYRKDDYELFEYGFLYESSAEGIGRYIFMEMPKDKTYENCKTIPAGKFYCRQSEANQIEQCETIFKDYLSGKNKFIAIETDIFTDKLNPNKPINELRLLVY